MDFGTSGNDQHEDKPAEGDGSRGERLQQYETSLSTESTIRIYGRGEGWIGVFTLLPHAGPAALVTLGYTGGSGLTPVAEKQQGDVLLPRQDSGDSSFGECTDNCSAWGFVVLLVRVGCN